MTEDQLLQVIGMIYDAVTDPARWDEASQAICRLLDAQRASLVVPVGGGRFSNLLARRDPPELARAYLEHYHRVDPFRADEAAARQAPSSAGVPLIKLGQQIVSERDLVRSEYYNDYARHLGAHHMIGAMMGAANPLPLALFRSEGRDAFGPEEVRLLGLLMPHLQRALVLGRTLRASAWTAAAGQGALDVVQTGIIVVDADRRIQLMNAMAEQAVLAGRGLRFARSPVGAGQVLQAKHRHDDAQLQRLVLDVAAQAGTGGALRLRGPAHSGEDWPLGVLVSPLPARLAGQAHDTQDGVALLVLRDLSVPAPPAAELLRTLFGLSTAEAAVALALAGGNGLEQVAQARNVGLETVRSQSRAVLRKMGARSLRDFERTMALLTRG